MLLRVHVLMCLIKTLRLLANGRNPLTSKKPDTWVREDIRKSEVYTCLPQEFCLPFFPL